MSAAGWRSSGTVAIMAGSGELPALLADRLEAAGRPYRILAFRGFCDRSIKARADAVVNLLDVRGALARLRSWEPAAITLAGGLTRPSVSALIGAFAAYRSREEVTSLATRGDDNLLRGALEFLESKGFNCVGVLDLAPELLASPGLYGAHRPSPAEEAEIALGLRLLDSLAPFDIGQAVAVAGERVLGIEGPEGTDRLLARVRGLRGWRFLGRRAGGGVLVKAPKTCQDLRVDLPAIGPRTVENAARAGFRGIAVASGLTLVINRAATVAAADKHGLFLVGADHDFGPRLAPCGEG